MGFMDKAKKLAEEAQQKLDDAQKQFNERQAPGSGAPAPVEYDAHGRPVGGVSVPPPPPVPPAPVPPVPPAPAADVPPPPPPAPPTAPADRKDEYAPPGLTSGDPLQG